MIRRPPRSTLFPYTNALPISGSISDSDASKGNTKHDPLVLGENDQQVEQADFVVGSLVRRRDRKSTRLNSSHDQISYAVFCLKKKNNITLTPDIVASNRTIVT